MAQIPYTGAFRSFFFSYPDGWTLHDNEDSVSLWKSEQGGAITLSAVVRKDPTFSGNALEHCKRFTAKHAFDPPRMSGNADVADAAFTDHEGVWCKVRFMAAGNRMILATYHASGEDPVEEAEVDAIFSSLRILTSRTN